MNTMSCTLLNNLMMMSTEVFMSRWLEVGDAEYERRMAARRRRNDHDPNSGCGLLILIFIVLSFILNWLQSG